MNFNKPQKLNRAEKIINIVDDYFDVKCKSEGKYTPIVLPRQMAMYYIRENLKLPLQSIGKLFPSTTSKSGFKDHATVLHNCKLISDLVNFDFEIKSYHLDLKDICKDVCILSEKELEKYLIIKDICIIFEKLSVKKIKEFKELLK
tara:strand:+ start:60 stop:497 length:438 start_codon:yes stop_codon:yes gene_type:complete